MLSRKMDLLIVIRTTVVALRSTEAIGMVENKTLSRKPKIDDTRREAKTITRAKFLGT